MKTPKELIDEQLKETSGEDYAQSRVDLEDAISDSELLEVTASGVENPKDPKIIQQLRKIVREKQMARIKDPQGPGSHAVDLFSASGIVVVFDSLHQANRDKFISLPLTRMVDVAFKLINKQSAKSKA